jgi:hypothetical protein
MLSASLAKRAIDGLLDRLTAERRPRSPQSVLVDVHQMLAHKCSIYFSFRYISGAAAQGSSEAGSCRHGTLALAGFTAWLARRTSAEVRISEKQIRLSRESIEALDRPFLMPARYPGEARASINQNLLLRLLLLENLERGPALLEGLKVIPVEDGINLRVALREQPAEGERFAVHVFYRSPSARQYLTLSDLLGSSPRDLDFTGHRRVGVR